MKRNVIILLIVSLLLQGCSDSSWNEKLISKISKDFTRNSYFIVVESDQNKYVVTNLEFFIYVKTKEELTEEKYGSYLYKMLRQSNEINIDQEDLTKFNFIRITEEPKFANRSSNELLELYFRKIGTNYVCLDVVSPKEIHNLVYRLFQQHVISKIDDESGYLVVPDFQFAL